MIGGGGSVRPVSGIAGPSASVWLRRQREGLEAQHRALDEGRIDDLVGLIGRKDDDEASPDEGDGERREDQASEGASDEKLAREVTLLATELEERIARVRAEALEELQEFDRRSEGARFDSARGVSGGGKRGGQFNGYF